MKKVKFILIIMGIFILSGCTVNESISIDSSNRVKENITILEDNNSLSSNDSVNVVNQILNKYKSALNLRKYEWKIVKEDEATGANLVNNYENICDFVDNTVFSQYLYKKINCIEEDDYYELSSYGENIFYCESCSDWPRISNINLKITLPVKAEEDNADGVNNNTYTWVFDKNTSKSKSIYIKINKEDIKEEKKQEIKRNERKKTVSKIKLIGVVIILFTILIIVFYMLYKKYKSNKLEY